MEAQCIFFHTTSHSNILSLVYLQFVTSFLHLYLLFSLLLWVIFLSVIMTPKCSRTSAPSTSSAQQNQSAIIHPTHKFMFEVHGTRFLPMKNFNVIQERSFNPNSFYEYPKFMDKLVARNWFKLNNLIQETNLTIGLEFFVDAFNHGMNDYTSYVRGKYIDYLLMPLTSCLICVLLSNLGYKIDGTHIINQVK